MTEMFDVEGLENRECSPPVSDSERNSFSPRLDFPVLGELDTNSVYDRIGMDERGRLEFSSINFSITIIAWLVKPSPYSCYVQFSTFECSNFVNFIYDFCVL